MAEEPRAGGASLAEPIYPPDSLADLLVSILASTEGNHFDVRTALSTVNVGADSTTNVTTSSPCTGHRYGMYVCVFIPRKVL